LKKRVGCNRSSKTLAHFTRPLGIPDGIASSPSHGGRLVTLIKGGFNHRVCWYGKHGHMATHDRSSGDLLTQFASFKKWKEAGRGLIGKTAMPSSR
jgi:hypothetical protein